MLGLVFLNNKMNGSLTYSLDYLCNLLIKVLYLRDKINNTAKYPLGHY
uniref:Uncharacterized protein n=1 Tax=Anguilla anguilla TaxID=7936 RepID=A0A0E9PYI3_ANGAN